MTRMTAAEVVAELEDRADNWRDHGLRSPCAAYEDAAKIIRDHLVPRWQAAPDGDGWYWCKELESDSPPQKVALHTMGTNSEGRDIQPIWKRWSIAGWVALSGPVCPISPPPEVTQ